MLSVFGRKNYPFSMENDTVTFVVESKKFNFSKKKLSERSVYFNIMFTSDFMEKNQSVIELQGITATCWEEILNYVNSGQFTKNDDASTNEMLSLLNGATMYQFHDLQDAVVKWIHQSLTVRNAFEILEMASRLDIAKLLQKSRAIALWLFDDITKLQGFFKLTGEQVEGFISDRALHSELGELGVWEGIDRWINYGGDEFFAARNQHLPNLIKCLCLKKLSWRDLKVIKLYRSTKSCPLVLDAVTRVIKEKIAKESGKFEKPKPPKKRAGRVNDTSVKDIDPTTKFIQEWKKTKARKLPYVPAVVGNVRTGPDTVSPCILKFCLTEKRYIPVLRLNKVENSLGSMVGFKVIGHGSKLYMLGGEMMTRQSAWNHAMWEYDQIFGTWTFLANLLKPSRHVSACCTGDDLYILGGFGRHRVLQDSVYKFSLKTNTWTICSPLPKPMYSVAVCSYRGYLYVFESSIYQYVPATDLWVKILTSPTTKGFTNAMADDEYIYLAGAYTRSVFKFDPNMPQQDVELVGNFKNECVQACLVGNYVYSLSQDEFGEDIYCEKMNKRTGDSTVLYEGTTDSKIVDLNPRHHHGCFPLLMY